MSRQESLWDTPNAISSQASEAGLMRSGLRDGLMIDQSGPAPALASLSPRQVGEKGVLTSGTCGRTGFTSSGSVSLQSCLESRLRQNLPCPGSTLFVMTWKQRVTPSGRLICALRVSGRRTYGKDFGSWGTPRVTTNGGHPSPQCTGKGSRLEDQAGLISPWRTPASQDPGISIDRLQTKEGEPYNPEERVYDKKTGRVLQTNLATDVKMLAGWQTPKLPSGGGQEVRLTPGGGLRKLEDQALLSGPPANGSPAGTGSSGQLNPAFPLWLHGFPAEWDDCAPRAMPSRRK